MRAVNQAISKTIFREGRIAFNAANIKKEIDEDGYLINYDVPIARIGDFVYRAYEFSFMEEDGIDPSKPLTVYRDETSFSKEVLSKNKDIPFTNDHPDGAVTVDNARDVRVGTVGDLYLKNGTLYAEKIVVYDKGTIEDIEERNKKEVSIGFQASYLFQPVTINGKDYDGTEQVIRINHLSLVDAGKAGPEFKMHHKEEVKMSQEITTKVMVDDVSVDVPMDKAFAINQARTESMIEKMANAISALTTKVEALAVAVNAKNEDEKEDKEEKKEESENAKNEDDKEDKEEKKEESENAKNDDMEEMGDSKNEQDGKDEDPVDLPVAKNSAVKSEKAEMQRLFGFNSYSDLPNDWAAMNAWVSNKVFNNEEF